MSAIEMNIHEDILKVKYLKFSKIILILAVLYALWVIILILSVYFLGIYKFAFLTTDQWIISSIILLGVFVGLDIIFILHHYMAKKKRIESEKPKPLHYKGKKLHIYTLPADSKGGIFSKTYIKIDEDNILNLRFQMIPPNGLWEKKE
jgi:hypothetical protein